MNSLRIVIADDHEIVRKGIRALLEASNGLEICGEAEDGAGALAQVRKHKPHVLLLDIGLPDRSGLEITRIVRKEFPATEVLILTMHESPAIVTEALAAGALGLVYKSDVGRVLVQAIEAVSQRKLFLSPHVTSLIVKEGLRPADEAGLQNLTDRELKVLRMIAEGKSVKEAAGELGISHKTVNVHRANIMGKLQLHSLADLIYFALRNKIVKL